MMYPEYTSRERARQIITENPGAPPHCNQNIVHAPGDCVWCDETPGWQDGVTEFSPVDDHWGGNRAVKDDDRGQVVMW